MWWADHKYLEGNSKSFRCGFSQVYLYSSVSKGFAGPRKNASCPSPKQTRKTPKKTSAHEGENERKCQVSDSHRSRQITKRQKRQESILES